MTSDLTEITVIGDDDTGLVARVTSLLFERGCNIEDVDQAVRDGVFRMSLAVDTAGMVCTAATLRADLEALGEELGLDVQVRFPADRETQRIAVLVTRERHCLEALFDARADDELGAEIAVVIGNHDDLEGLAEAHGVPFHDVGTASGEVDEERLLDRLGAYDVDLVVLARFMRILSPNVVFRYEDRIINVHPSLLPAFPGAEAYRQAIEAGVRIAGVTAHYVTTDLDQGPIITQRAFDVPDDADRQAMRERGQPLEADALLEAVRLHLNGDVSVHRGRTTVRENGERYQLGLPAAARRANPDEPVDGPDERHVDAARSP
ncbi:formyltetrahydrofolate deformylase [Halovivax limisalsi]|uniref:formyltetrahydrofolate deformylase n=1 Tax=Halovivax limisalsi TaxID=1453760 RepID=UPI001FFD8A16|nr:formyltetrahydrofolate deformylase [Halovivax limisalsi]